MERWITRESIAGIKNVLPSTEIINIDSKINSLKNNRNFPVSEYCINKFLKTETDQQSVSLRGVGRITDEIPRFGGYFRKNNHFPHENDMFELEKLFKGLIYIGYITHMIRCEEVLKPTECHDKYKLYQTWLMFFLRFNRSLYSSEIQTIHKASKSITENIKKKLKDDGYNITGDQEETLDNILLFYGIAGFALRRREMGLKL